MIWACWVCITGSWILDLVQCWHTAVGARSAGVEWLAGWLAGLEGPDGASQWAPSGIPHNAPAFWERGLQRTGAPSGEEATLAAPYYVTAVGLSFCYTCYTSGGLPVPVPVLLACWKPCQENLLGECLGRAVDLGGWPANYHLGIRRLSSSSSPACQASTEPSFRYPPPSPSPLLPSSPACWSIRLPGRGPPPAPQTSQRKDGRQNFPLSPRVVLGAAASDGREVDQI